MATCKDCICYSACDYHIDEETVMTVEECGNFKNKADFVEVKHGHFVRNERNIPKMKEFHEKGFALSMNTKSIFWTCSCCGSWASLTQKYCSECGAKMDVAQNTTTERGGD